MAIIQSGLSGTSLLTVDPTLTSARVATRPIEQLGTYSIGAFTGALTGVTSSASIFSFRFVAGTVGTGAQLAILQKITLNFVLTTGFTAAQQLNYGAYVARSFTGADTGGTTVTMTGNSQKNRTNMPTSQMGTAGGILISTTGALTAGTRTLDGQAFAVTNGWAGTTLATTGSQVLQQVVMYENVANEYPIIMANNEGFVINNITSMGATGVITVAIGVEWTESASTASGIAY